MIYRLQPNVPRTTVVWHTFLAALGAFAGALAAAAGGVEMASVGLLFAETYHGEEVAAENGDAYFAVVREGDDWTLVPTLIEVSRVEDPIFDLPGEKTGKRVQAGGVEPLFLVRGDFSPGPVETVEARGASLFGSPRFELELAPLGAANGLRYRLAVDCPRVPEPSPEEQARGEFPAAWRELCPLELEYAGTTQQLAELSVNRLHDSGAALLWAGDLDRDGRLDLLVDLSDHYNVSEPTLFLSSAAAAGELVAPVARLVATGC